MSDTNPVELFLASQDQIRELFSDKFIAFITWIASEIAGSRFDARVFLEVLTKFFRISHIAGLFLLLIVFFIFAHPFEAIRSSKKAKGWKMSDFEWNNFGNYDPDTILDGIVLPFVGDDIVGIPFPIVRTNLERRPEEQIIRGFLDANTIFRPQNLPLNWGIPFVPPLPSPNVWQQQDIFDPNYPRTVPEEEIARLIKKFQKENPKGYAKWLAKRKRREEIGNLQARSQRKRFKFDSCDNANTGIGAGPGAGTGAGIGPVFGFGPLSPGSGSGIGPSVSPGAGASVSIGSRPGFGALSGSGFASSSSGFSSPASPRPTLNLWGSSSSSPSSFASSWLPILSGATPPSGLTVGESLSDMRRHHRGKRGRKHKIDSNDEDDLIASLLSAMGKKQKSKHKEKKGDKSCVKSVKQLEKERRKDKKHKKKKKASDSSDSSSSSSSDSSESSSSNESSSDSSEGPGEGGGGEGAVLLVGLVISLSLRVQD
jgi:hypothetical protein